MARKYNPIWEQLKKKKETVVKCRHSAHKTLIQGVMKEKSRENAPRMQLDLPSYGKMSYDVVKLAGDWAIVTFKLAILTRAEDL